MSEFLGDYALERLRTLQRLASEPVSLSRRRFSPPTWLDRWSASTERGRLTNAEIRRLSGYSRYQVLKLMHSLREEGLVEVRGRGRGAHYVPVQ